MNRREFLTISMGAGASAVFAPICPISTQRPETVVTVLDMEWTPDTYTSQHLLRVLFVVGPLTPTSKTPHLVPPPGRAMYIMGGSGICPWVHADETVDIPDMEASICEQLGLSADTLFVYDPDYLSRRRNAGSWTYDQRTNQWTPGP